jgi:hypothetical protein
MLISSIFSTVDFITDVNFVREMWGNSFGTASFVVLMVSTFVQAALAATLRESPMTILSSFVGVKPLVQTWYVINDTPVPKHQVASYELCRIYSDIAEIWFDVAPFAALQIYFIVYDPKVPSLTVIISLASTVTSAAALMSKTFLHIDRARSFRRYYPRYYGILPVNEKHGWPILMGVKCFYAGALVAKVLSVCVLFHTSALLTFCWIGAEIGMEVGVMHFHVDQLQYPNPNVNVMPLGRLTGLVWAIIGFFGGMFCPTLECRVPWQFTPRVFGVITTYDILVNPVMVAVAFRTRPYLYETEVWGVLAITLFVVSVGVALFFSNMDKSLRSSFWNSDNLRSYLSEMWDTRTSASPGMGEGPDPAHAHILVNFHSKYWPLAKVRTWLARWPEWQADNPAWFTSHWRAKIHRFALPTCSVSRRNRAGGRTITLPSTRHQHRIQLLIITCFLRIHACEQYTPRWGQEWQSRGLPGR